MKTKMMIRPLLVAGLLAGLAIPALANENEQTVAWADVPSVVQKTITANANGSTVAKVESETEKGATTYEAKVKAADGSKTKIKVAADGSLIKAKADEDKDKDADHEDDDNDGDGK